MKIGLAQIDCVVGDVEVNCTKVETYIEKAAAKGCDLVVFPEMSDTGYVPSKFIEAAGSWPGSAFDRISRAAAQSRIAVIIGLSELEATSVYNSVACFNSSGDLIGSYRKLHLFSPEPASEDRACVAGDSYSIVKLGDIQFGLSICYDLRFPELYRALALQGATVLVNCAAWPTVRSEHWRILSRARAVENQCFYVGVSRVGTDEGFEMGGASCIVDHQGEILVEAQREESLVAEKVDSTLIQEIRKKIPVLTSRRQDVYGDLGCEPQ